MYNIEVQTGDEQTEALDSPVYMQIFGTTTTTPKFFLEAKNASFTKNSISKFNISTNNVGEVKFVDPITDLSIRFFFEDSTNHHWSRGVRKSE